MENSLTGFIVDHMICIFQKTIVRIARCLLKRKKLLSVRIIGFVIRVN